MTSYESPLFASSACFGLLSYIIGANDTNPQELFPAAAKALSDLKIAFLELREPDFHGTFGRAEVT